MSEEEENKYSVIVAGCVKTSSELLTAAKKLYSELQEGEGREGISLYEVKNHDLLAYMHDLAYLMYEMSYGNKIEGDAAIERLVYLRTVLERIRPLEHRMRTQIERLISLSGSVENKTKVLRPHPERLKMDENEGKSSDSDQGSLKEAKVKKYVPPKVVAVHYNDEETAGNREIERARRRALQSSLVQDLRAHYSEAPEEFKDDVVMRKRKQRDIEKEKYEEDYLIRLQMTKKERHYKRLESRQNILDELLDFGSYMPVKNAQQSNDGRTAGKKWKRVGRKRKPFKKLRYVNSKSRKGKS